ncbi:hypothetical protein I7X12_00335 [Halosimplex litoreum]|uniref:Uncharacterized protein n=1 Tax=Halosimplex litoreum TaxID=1198301 RepID=A0A7T3FYR9_9EURY|nr:HTH domain-containing protein [Halosimplex litoreum]QPV63116.1 hypothetical protein I7X12_00335 [Halosimplex litoreum]
MQGGTGANETLIEVYVRSLRPRPGRSQRRALDRLDALAAAGEIGGYEVVVWGDRAPPSPDAVRTRAGRFVLDRVTVFQRWAERNGASIEGAFAVRTVDSSVTGERHDELVLPRLVAAAVRNGRLLAVAPATVDGGHRSIEAFLDGLEDGALPGERSVEIRPLGAARTAESTPTDDRDRREPPSATGETTARPEAADRSSTTRPSPAESAAGPAEEGSVKRSGGRGDRPVTHGGGEGEAGEGRGGSGRTSYPPY